VEPPTARFASTVPSEGSNTDNAPPPRQYSIDPSGEKLSESVWAVWVKLSTTVPATRSTMSTEVVLFEPTAARVWAAAWAPAIVPTARTVSVRVRGLMGISLISASCDSRGSTCRRLYGGHE
jgi:hypothetical protein